MRTKSTHTHMQRQTGNHIQKVIQTTCRTVFPITNVTVDEENIWNANEDVMNNKFNEVYNTVVYWRKSLFLLTSGSTGKRFIEELTRLINSGTFRSEQDTIALKALMVLPTLPLQKSSSTLKSKDKVQILKKRLNEKFSGKMDK